MPTWQQLTPGRQTYLNPTATSVNAFSPGLGLGGVMPSRTNAAAGQDPFSKWRDQARGQDPFAFQQPALETPMESFTAKYGVGNLGEPEGKYGIEGQGVVQNKYGIDNSMSAEQDAYNNQAVGGQATAVGGNWAALDAHNAEINAAAAKFGVPANLIKSMINRESSGNWDANNYTYGGLRGQRMLPFVGIFESTAQSWGLDFNAMQGNKQAQIDGMAKIISGLANQYGGFENAAYVYFGGPQALEGGFTDEYGMDSNTYGQKAIDGWKQLDQMSGYNGGYQYSNGSEFNGNNFVQQAMQYVGVAYNWGSIPGANQDPWQTGWDCSGFTYFMNQKYGDGSLPQGSHYQYQTLSQQGKIFTNQSQLQPGDLVFIDTGWQGGAGAELNRAGHVGIYIGNGQMIHAANPNQGTIVSPLSGYGGILGYAHQSGSGGGTGFGGAGQRQRPRSFLDQYLFRQAA